jgi:hypothetical protein
MIAFGTSVTKPDVFRRCAEPGIRRVAEDDSQVEAMPAIGSIFRSYNALLDRFAECEGLEALVLVHQDAEIVDTDFCATIRETLRDPAVGLVGCVGAVGVRSIAWWEASVTCASFVNRYEEHGGGELPSFSWSWSEAPAYARLGEVETLDGFVLVLPPWTVRNIRFDESLGQFHGYDLDYCLQVRAAGRKVVTAGFRAIHHRALHMLPDAEEWTDAHMRVADKWDGEMGIGGGVGSWKDRARRAEADAAAARLLGHQTRIAREAQLRELERAIDEATHSISWRITMPLRLFARPRRQTPIELARPSLGSRVLDARTRG